jgi:hypothetical protein
MTATLLVLRVPAFVYLVLGVLGTLGSVWSLGFLKSFGSFGSSGSHNTWVPCALGRFGPLGP